MTKTEMLEILRGKVLQESPEEVQSRLNEIADELEQSERVVRCGECESFSEGLCDNEHIGAMVFRMKREETDYCSYAKRKGGE